MPLNLSLCSGCPIQGLYDPLESRGPENARFLIVTDTPSQASAREDRLLTKHQMALLGTKLIDAGFGREEFRFTSAVRCGLDPNEHTSKVKREVLKHCRQHLLAEIENHELHQGQKYEAIIPLGAQAASQAFGKAVKITKCRGSVTQSEELGIPIFPLMSPGLVVMYEQNLPIFLSDIASLARAVSADYDVAAAAAEQIGDYQAVTDLQFLIDLDPEIISFDTETTGLQWYQTGVNVRSYKPALHKKNPFFKPKFQILTMQFSVKENESYMLVWDHPENPIPERDKPRLRNQLRQLLCKEGRIVIGQSKADNVWLWMTEGIRYRIGGDTLMLATLLDENMPEKNLDILTKIHVPSLAGYADHFSATHDKSRMWEIPLSELGPYAMGDSDATLRLYNVLEPLVMEDEKLWNNYCRVVIPGLNAFAAMETRGMPVDEGKALAEFKASMIELVSQQEAELLAAIPRVVKQDVVAKFLASKGGKGKTAADALSFGRKDFLKDVLFNHPKGFRLRPKVFTKSTANLNDETKREPSTSSKDHLPYFFDDCPFTIQLAEYLKNESLLTKSIISFEKKYIHRGMVRPNYHLHVTVTGRSSSANPNGQNGVKRGPQAKAYRRMYVAPPGHYVISCDLSQAELRIVACMANDKTMIDIYRRNGDIHKTTAAIALGVTDEQFSRLEKLVQKEARQKAKAINFGYVFGMWWRKFIGYAKTQYGVDFTEKEAQRVRNGFFSKYSALTKWHERMKAFAQKHKYVRSFSGRIRHLPTIDSPEEYIQQEAGRQAINAPIQNFASELGVMTQARVDEEIDPKMLQVVGFVHDAIVAFVPCEYLDWGMKTLKHYMESNPIEEWFGVRLQVPIVADAEFGENLGDTFELEGFSLDEPFDYTSLTDKDGNLLIEVPPQKIPPNNGRLTRSPYTTPDDLEDEDVMVVTSRSRMIRASIKKTAGVVERIERSTAQMKINRRNRALRQEVEKARRAQPLVRRTRNKTVR